MPHLHSAFFILSFLSLSPLLLSCCSLFLVPSSHFLFSHYSSFSCLFFLFTCLLLKSSLISIVSFFLFCYHLLSFLTFIPSYELPFVVMFFLRSSLLLLLSLIFSPHFSFHLRITSTFLPPLFYHVSCPPFFLYPLVHCFLLPHVFIHILA